MPVASVVRLPDRTICLNHDFRIMGVWVGLAFLSESRHARKARNVVRIAEGAEYAEYAEKTPPANISLKKHATSANTS